LHFTEQNSSKTVKDIEKVTKKVWKYGKCLQYSSNRMRISAAIDFWAIFENVENREN